MNAPERVWVEFRNPFVDFARWNDATGGEPYIRADLYDVQAAESAELRRQLADAREVKPLEWGADTPPNDQCSYDHCVSSGGAWRYRIEWKSWKDYDAPCIYRDDEYVDTARSVLAAKAAAQADYEARILSALKGAAK